MTTLFRSNLAEILHSQRGNPSEVRQLREQEAGLLARDVQLLPDQAIIRYRYGLLLYQLGRFEEAERELVEACQIEPTSYDCRLALTLLYEKRAQLAADDKRLQSAKRQWQQAVASCRELMRLRPNDRVVLELMQRIQSGARATP